MELPHTLPTDGPCPFEKTRVGKEPTWVEGYVGMRLAYEDMGMHVFMVHASLHTDKTHKQTHTRARTHTHTLTHSLTLSLSHTHTQVSVGATGAIARFRTRRAGARGPSSCREKDRMDTIL